MYQAEALAICLTDADGPQIGAGPLGDGKGLIGIARVHVLLDNEPAVIIDLSSSRKLVINGRTVESIPVPKRSAHMEKWENMNRFLDHSRN